jgi:hypothetical protein
LPSAEREAVTSDSTIAKELFSAVIEYCEELESGRKSPEDGIGKNNPLVFFVENFLEQFSSGFCRQKIVGLTDRSSRQLINERARLERKSELPETQRLIYQLEQMSYSTSESHAEDFHLQYFPYFLDRVVGWLEEVEAEDDLLDAATEALDHYNSSVGLQ